jgi:hypothetical protein
MFCHWCKNLNHCIDYWNNNAIDSFHPYVSVKCVIYVIDLRIWIVVFKWSNGAIDSFHPYASVKCVCHWCKSLHVRFELLYLSEVIGSKF